MDGNLENKDCNRDCKKVYVDARQCLSASITCAFGCMYDEADISRTMPNGGIYFISLCVRITTFASFP